MGEPIKIIETGSAEHVVSLEHSFILKVIPAEKRDVRNLENYSIYSCIDNIIGVLIKDVVPFDRLFPTDLVYDFKGIDIKFQNGDWVEPNFLQYATQDFPC